MFNTTCLQQKDIKVHIFGQATWHVVMWLIVDDEPVTYNFHAAVQWPEVSDL
jgi:hypothetical protein